jgi:hypothetical protein
LLMAGSVVGATETPETTTGAAIFDPIEVADPGQTAPQDGAS